VDVSWSALFARRLVRPFVSPQERLFIDNPCEWASKAGIDLLVHRL
jgi:hypothetical protein